MINRASLEFIRYFLRAFPGRTAAMVVMLILAGFAEGVGVLALLPLLEITLSPDASGAGRSAVANVVANGLGHFGLAPSLPALLSLIVVAMTMKGVLLWFAMRQVGYTVAGVAASLRLDLVRALIGARWSYIAKHRSGHFVNSISMEAQQTGWAYKDACAALAGVIQVLVYLTVAVMVSWSVAVIAAVVGLAVMFMTQRFVRMSRGVGVGLIGSMKEITGRLAELLPGIKPIKTMAREREFRELLERETEGFATSQRRMVLAQETLRAFREPIFVFVVAVGLYLAIAAAAMAIPTVALLAVMFYRVLVAVGDLQSRYQTMVVGEAAFWSLRSNIDQARAAAESFTGQTKPPDLARSLRLEGVSVSYDEHPVLEAVDLDLPAGRFITLVGPSGSGKTTLVDVLTGLIPPQAGRVLVDGTPLDELDLTAWRSQIGYVPQDPLLFHDTVERNVTLGRSDVSPEQVREALYAAGALPFVDRWPEGVQRVIGERGGRLSGGQRQRIAIARALLGRPRLLILDEATTALDPETEAGICRTLRALAGTLTVISISHQPAMQRAAEVIVKVDPDGVRIASQTPATAS